MAGPVSPSLPASPAPPPSETKARAAARQFEAVFAGQMAKLMMESVEQDESFSGGHDEEMFRGVLAETLGGEIAKGRGIGLGDKVMAEIIRLQQAQGGSK